MEKIYSLFDHLVQKYITPDSLVLDAGCGAKTRFSNNSEYQFIIGVDEDSSIVRNQQVDEKVISSLDSLPFANKTFDMIVTYMVVEHMEDPEKCFAEFYRVCKQGAKVIIATPNLYHYANYIVSITPTSWHDWYLKNIQKVSEKSFAVKHKANTAGKLIEVMRRQGFILKELQYIDLGPVHVYWIKPLYFLGMLYHKLVNHFEKLSFLRADLFLVFEK